MSEQEELVEGTGDLPEAEESAGAEPEPEASEIEEEPVSEPEEAEAEVEPAAEEESPAALVVESFLVILPAKCLNNLVRVKSAAIIGDGKTRVYIMTSIINFKEFTILELFK